MKTIHAVIEINKDGFGLWFDEIDNVFAYGETVEKVKQDAKDALNSYIDTLKELKFPIPLILKDKWEIQYRFDVQAMLTYFDGILTKSALSKLTGINSSLLSQYLMGIKKPRAAQLKRIQSGIHNLGEKLLNVQL